MSHHFLQLLWLYASPEAASTFHNSPVLEADSLRYSIKHVVFKFFNIIIHFYRFPSVRYALISCIEMTNQWTLESETLVSAQGYANEDHKSSWQATECWKNEIKCLHWPLLLIDLRALHRGDWCQSELGIVTDTGKLNVSFQLNVIIF